MTFEDWFYGLEGFGIRAERANEDIKPADPIALAKWLKAAWLVGAERVIELSFKAALAEDRADEAERLLAEARK